jgi:hypothetical protein
MDNSNLDAYSERRSQELDQLEQDAKEAGRTVKSSLLDEGRRMSEDALVAFASALAQLYLQRHIDHLEPTDITLYMLLYLRFFGKGYDEVRPDGGVTYFPSPFK